MKSGAAFTILCAILFLSACSKTEIIQPEPDRCQLVDSIASKYYYNGINRQYLVYIPDSLPAGSPLIFALHGENQNALDLFNLGFNAYADTNKFAICYPQAIHCNWETDVRNATDLKFLRILAQYLQTKHNLSPAKTYAVGYSQGGTMANMIAIDGGDVFKATTCIAGNIKQSIIQDCYPPYAVPTFTIHGLLDDVNPIAGDANKKTAPMKQIMQLWKNTNACYFSADTSMLTDSTIAMVYKDSLATKEIWYYAIKGQGHDLPGLVKNGQLVDKSGFIVWDEIWKFFKKWK